MRVSSLVVTSPLAVPVSAAAGRRCRAALRRAAAPAARARCRRGRRRRRRRLRGRLDVGLHDPPAGAGARRRGEVDAVLARDAPRDRRGLDARRSAVARGRRRRGSAGGAAPAARRRRPRGAGSRRAAAVGVGAAVGGRLAAALARRRRRRRRRSRAITSPIGSVSPSAATISSTPSRRPRRSSSPCRSRSRRARSPRATSSPSDLSQLEDRALLHRVRQAGHDDVGHRRGSSR